MTNYFDRYTKLIIKNPSSKTEKTITTDDLTIVFQTRTHDSSGSANSYGATIQEITAEIGIFNLSDDTIKDIQHEDSKKHTGGSTVTLISGYKEHHGVIFSGLVAAMKQETHGADVLTVLGCRESAYLVENAVVNHTFTTAQKLSKIVGDLASMAGIPIGRIDDCVTKTTAEQGRTYDSSKSLNDIFIELCAECVANGEQFEYTFDQGALYFLNRDNKKRTLYELTPTTGLLSAYYKYDTAYTNDSFDVTAVMLPDIQWRSGVIISVGGGENLICAVSTKPTYISNGKQHCTKFLATVAEEMANI